MAPRLRFLRFELMGVLAAGGNVIARLSYWGRCNRVCLFAADNLLYLAGGQAHLPGQRRIAPINGIQAMLLTV